MLPPNIGFTPRDNLAVFTRSAIIPPKVNRFAYNLKHFEYIVGGWPADFGRDPRSSDSLRGSRKFFVRQITHDFADFPSAKFHEI